MSQELTELRGKRDNLQDILHKIFTEAKDGEDYNFRQVKCLDEAKALEGYAKSMRVAEIVQEKNAELDLICIDLEKLGDAEKAAAEFKRLEDEPANKPQHPAGKGEKKSLGQLITGHALYTKWRGGSRDGEIVIPEYGLKELKTLFQTTAGWAPESTRIGEVVDAVTRPIQVLDIMPIGQTGQAAVVYMEETTRTHASAEKAEGTAYAESTFVLTEKSTTVRKITDSIPVTDEQLEDVPMVESYLDSRLQFGVRQRLDNQMLNGDGNAPNLEGILNATGIQTQAKGADPVPDAVFKAMTKVRVTGRAIPTHYITHPNDWQQIRLLRTADGIYIWGSPAEAGVERIWGLPVVQADSLTEGTGLVGSFIGAWIMLFERRGIIVETGFVNDDFTKGKKALRASMRAALAIFRPAAFATTTGI